MTVRPIVQGEVPLLRQMSERVCEFDTQLSLLLTDLLDTLEANRALGLAAVQIGVPVRAIVVDSGSGPLALVNPEVVERVGEVIGAESCLSFPDLVLEVKRPEHIRLQALDVTGAPIEVTADGLEARILCHEVDHANGILFMDHLSDETLFEQLLTQGLSTSTEQEQVDHKEEASTHAQSEDSDLRLAADLLADAAWKAVLGQQLLEEKGQSYASASELNRAIDILERAGTALLEALEPGE